MKWKHTRLPEDVQNQQRSHEMTMIHRVLIMNIIHVLAHGDTDEIRPSDMDNKLLYMLAFSPVYLVCQMYNPTSLPSLLGHIVDQIILTWFSHYRLHSSSLTGVAVKPSIQAVVWHLDVFIITFINLHILVESYMPPHRMITQLRTVYSKIVHNCYWYTDYTHCSWMNNALVTRHETWSAYENYVWLTVTSS